MFSAGVWKDKGKKETSRAKTLNKKRHNIRWSSVIDVHDRIQTRSNHLIISRDLLKLLKDIFIQWCRTVNHGYTLVEYYNTLRANTKSLCEVAAPSEVELLLQLVNDLSSQFKTPCRNWDIFMGLIKSRTNIQLPADEYGVADTDSSGYYSLQNRLQQQSYPFSEPPPHQVLGSSQPFKLMSVKLGAQYGSIREHSAGDVTVMDRVEQTMRRPVIESDTHAMDTSDNEDDQLDDGFGGRQRSVKDGMIFERLNSGGTDSELAAVHAILQIGPTNDVVIKKYNVEFLRKDMCCLKPRTWLNDEVINFYMNMLQDRDQSLCTKDSKRTPSYYFSSFFMERLLVTDNGYAFRNVARWSRKIDVFSMKNLFFPINISNTHWTLAVVSITNKTITYYDSMSGSGRNYLQGLLHWLQDEAVDQTKDSVKAKQRIGKPQEVVSVDEWKLLSQPRGQVPQQNNGFDCGVFSIVCADFLSDELPLSYTQQNMPYFRLKIACDIKRGHLTYSEWNMHELRMEIQ